MLEQGGTSRLAARRLPPAITINAAGRSPFVLVCDHASNRIPDRYADLGLGAIDRLRHIAWDPGALAVSLAMSDLLDAPLVQSTVSRLVVDCNRAGDAPDLIVAISERTEIPGNYEVGATERWRRIAEFHAPFHAAVAALLDARAGRGEETVLVCMHSFTPVYKGIPRSWPVGLIHGSNSAYTRRLLEALNEEAPALEVGWNEPYAGLRGVTYTLEHHGDGRGLNATMIEIRNDEILEPEGIANWAALLARCLEAARPAVEAVPFD